MRLPANSSLYGSLGLLLALIWSTFRTGPQTLYYLNSDAQRALNWPDPELPSAEGYTLTSPIDAMIFQLTGSTSVTLWVALHCAAILAAVVLLGLWLSRHAGIQGARRHEAWRLLLLSPLFALLLAFIGSYDPFTVILLAITMFAWTSGSRVWLLLAGVGLGVAHAEQGFLAIGALALGAVWGRQSLPARMRSLPTPAWALVGIVLGRGSLSLYLQANEVSSGFGRADWLLQADVVRSAVLGSFNLLPVAIMGAFAGLWVLVIQTLVNPGRRTICHQWAVPLAVLFLWSIITLDHTRVFILTSLPVVMVLMAVYLSVPRSPDNRSIRLLVEAAAWIVVPVRILTSPDGPTFIMDVNVLDHWVMWISHLTNGGWI